MSKLLLNLFFYRKYSKSSKDGIAKENKTFRLDSVISGKTFLANDFLISFWTVFVLRLRQKSAIDEKYKDVEGKF